MKCICPSCGKESWLKRTPVFEGFKRTGESLSCALCGRAFPAKRWTSASEGEDEVPAGGLKKPALFSEADRSAVLRVFGEGENSRLCRYCEHYVVNPFSQRCGLVKKTVEATDTCGRFSPKPPEEDPLKPVEDDPLKPVADKKAPLGS